MDLTRARDTLNRILAPADLALVRQSTVAMLDRATKPSRDQDAWLPPGATEYLRPDNPRLVDLRRRYEGHPATASSSWSDERVRRGVDAKYFRGHTKFVYQQDGFTHPAQYAWAAEYVRQHDRLGLLDRLTEDRAFGTYIYEVDGLDVSRDLLDSILEINVLDEHFGLTDMSAPSVLEIGAGYGRLAHRLCSAVPAATYYCADGIPLSTFISEYYLQFRQTDRAHVVPLDEIQELVKHTHFDIAVNVHSFPECPLGSIRWWIKLLGSTSVPQLLIVDDEPGLLSRELDGTRLPYQSLLADEGFQLVSRVPKFAHSAPAQERGLYPDYHYLFKR